MSTIVGGRRILLIQDAFYNMVRDGLEQLGYFVPNPGMRQDVKFIPEQLDDSEPIAPNTIGLSFEGFDSFDWEMGSTLERNEGGAYIDIFAENEFIGQQIAGDVRDILRGKFTEHGREGTFFKVLGTSGEELFDCDIESIQMSRVREYDRPSKRYWWVVGGIIVDFYQDDRD